jgi:hypothetical protein
MDLVLGDVGNGRWLRITEESVEGALTGAGVRSGELVAANGGWAFMWVQLI